MDLCKKASRRKLIHSPIVVRTASHDPYSSRYCGLNSINLMPCGHANDEDPGSHFVKPAGYQLAAGEHTLYLRGRSAGYCIDRIHIYPDSMLPGSAAIARDFTKTESQTGACQ